MFEWNFLFLRAIKLPFYKIYGIHCFFMFLSHIIRNDDSSHNIHRVTVQFLLSFQWGFFHCFQLSPLIYFSFQFYEESENVVFIESNAIDAVVHKVMISCAIFHTIKIPTKNDETRKISTRLCIMRSCIFYFHYLMIEHITMAWSDAWWLTQRYS